jgi:anti-sigma-K factor RskA
MGAFIDMSDTRVLLREFDRSYPRIVRGEGVWLRDALWSMAGIAIAGLAVMAIAAAYYRSPFFLLRPAKHVEHGT